eukprot:9921517-Alexandrium_andersonii.AAC.1
MLLSDLATSGRARACERRPGLRKALLIDIRKAHLHAFVDEDVYVALPPEVAEPGKCAKLVRGLYGTRAAPSRWEALYTSTLEGFGSIRGRANACCFHHPARDVKCVVHGDDFTFTGLDVDLDWVQNQMEAHFLRKVEGRLGGGSGDLKEARLLNRVIRWTPHGYLYEADPRHAEQLVRDVLGSASGARAVAFPGFKRGSADGTAVAALSPSDA